MSDDRLFEVLRCIIVGIFSLILLTNGTKILGELINAGDILVPRIEYEVTENGLEQTPIKKGMNQTELSPSETEAIANIEPEEKEISIPLVISLSLLYTILILIIGGIASFYGVIWYLIKEEEEETNYENKIERKHIDLDGMALQRGMIIHCQAKYEAKKLMECLERHGFLWEDGDKPTEKLHFKKYGEDTCYNLGLNLYTGEIKNILSFNSADYYKRKNIEIIEFNDLEITENSELWFNKDYESN